MKAPTAEQPPLPFLLTMPNGIQPALYIQRVGLHSGRPSSEAIPNSYALHTENPHAFALCFAAYTAKLYYPHLHGTAQQFVTLSAVRQVLTPLFTKAPGTRDQLLAQVDAVNALLVNLEARRKALQEYRHALCLAI